MKSYDEYLYKCYVSGGLIRTIGRTALGYEIKLIGKGRGEARTLVVGSVHAREHITADLLFELISDYNGGYPIDVVPVLNVDGVLLADGGINALPLRKAARERLIKLNGGSDDFSQWKANIRGVDLNLNYDAAWGSGQGNLFYPAPHGYVGAYAGSEPETEAILNLLNAGKYEVVVAYHSKGEEVYWGFKDKLWHKDEAQSVADYLGYTLKTTPHSAGGLKDYWIDKYGKFGLTVEVGEDKYPHPYPKEKLSELKTKHNGILQLLGETAQKLWTRNL